MSTANKTYYTEEEFTALNKASDKRFEYRDGEIVSMSGGSLAHYVIERNIFGLFFNALKKSKCQAFTADSPVKSPIEKFHRFPDVSVVCGKVETIKILGIDCITNPTLIVEVLSKETEDVDKGKKLEAYKAIDSAKHIMLVAQDSAHIILYSRHGEKWERIEKAGIDETIKFSSLELSLSFTDIYEGIEIA